MDMDMDMFPRNRLGRMHDPFANFASYGFPQFGSMGRRRAAADHMNEDNDFFNRLPSEFRQYIPEGFGHRRAGSATTTQQPAHGQYYQNYVPTGTTPPNSATPQSPSKRLCDAAIQTEDPAGRSEVDSSSSAATIPNNNLSQHGLRNTVDMGVRSATENDDIAGRAHSAPPPEQQQQAEKQQQQQPQQSIPTNGRRQTPPSSQASPQAQFMGAGQQSPHFHKMYYPPQQQPHPQQKQQTPPPPQTPGGSYVRTIPIFVEGRSEPIINAHKDIPNQHTPSSNQNVPPVYPNVPHNTASASASANSAYVPYQPQQQPSQGYQQTTHAQPGYSQQQQAHSQQHPNRPTPINTQQQTQQNHMPSGSGLPPQTPHTLDSINKIQDIQRDVLDLMAKVEKFTGTRKDKEYVYLDEMLTRNLLKLDTIDTNGKESIRLARKEAIKCIQASINVLEAKAEANAQAALNNASGKKSPTPPAQMAATVKSGSKDKIETKETEANVDAAQKPQPVDATKIHEPIPLPPPEGMQNNDGVSDIESKMSQKQSSPAPVNDNGHSKTEITETEANTNAENK